jgi:hypothetical protein
MAPAPMPYGSSGRVPCPLPIPGAQPTHTATLDVRRKSRRVRVIDLKWRN